MTKERLFIKSEEICSDRFLHKGEQFIKEMNFNINLPKEREFKNGECIITNKDDTCYSINELVTILNFLHNNYYALLEENNKYQFIIKDALSRERTQLGQSVLRQLAEALEIEI